MTPVGYFYSICIVITILVFLFAGYVFIWEGKEVDAASEFKNN